MNIKDKKRNIIQAGYKAVDELVKVAKEKIVETEGCLSFPDLFLNINRPKEICVNYQDTTGKLNTVELKDYYARGFLHELDHLNGVVFIDYVGKLALKMARKKVHKHNKRKGNKQWHIQQHF